MNLFTKYTKEETQTLLKVAKMEFPRDEKKDEVPLFENISHKEILEITKDYKIEFLNKKSLINHNKIIYILQGSIALIHNSKIIQKVQKGQFYGISKNILHTKEKYSILVLEDCKIISFTINDSQLTNALTIFYKNLTKYLSTELSHCKYF